MEETGFRNVYDDEGNIVGYFNPETNNFVPNRYLGESVDIEEIQRRDSMLAWRQVVRYGIFLALILYCYIACGFPATLIFCGFLLVWSLIYGRVSWPMVVVALVVLSLVFRV